MKFNSNQKRTFKKLITKYENSKTYEESNKVKQRFYIKPSEILKNYYSDFADVDIIEDFDNDISVLASEGFVDILFKKNSSVIDKIYLNVDKAEEIRNIIGVKEKKQIKKEELTFFEEFLGRGGFNEWYSIQEIDKINQGNKIRYSIEESRIIFDLVDKIINNQNELLERELSIIVFGDSKNFEKHYRNKVCRLLLEYLKDTSQNIDFDLDVRTDTEKEHLLLEEYGIYQNPTYVFIKGNFIIKYADDKVIEGQNGMPIALSAGLLNQIEEIQVFDDTIVTVENLTSFHRIQSEDNSYIYTGGYTGRGVKNLLKQINLDNPDLIFFHFGDLDPDGFCILNNLIESTGIMIQPLHMSIDNIIKYKTFSKPLSERDRKLAASLIHKGCFTEILKYMLDENVKLEQEIITYGYE